MLEEIATAFKSVGTAPCDKYMCEKRQVCSAGELACPAFRWFVDSGHSINPHMDVKLRKSRFRPTEWLDDIRPTREIFVSIFGSNHGKRA